VAAFDEARERGVGVVSNRATEASRGSWAEIWRIEEVIDRGYAVATFYNGDVDPDTPEERGLQKYFPKDDSADDCGSIGAWAWGLQRAVDYLVTTPDIDSSRIVVTGHSRMGKAALLAAAFFPAGAAFFAVAVCAFAAFANRQRFLLAATIRFMPSSLIRRVDFGGSGVAAGFQAIFQAIPF
jgi:poly(3-hydroxybutyrate) depolymerase